jgi:hypothetical protein
MKAKLFLRGRGRRLATIEPSANIYHQRLFHFHNFENSNFVVTRTSAVREN